MWWDDSCLRFFGAEADFKSSKDREWAFSNAAAPVTSFIATADLEDANDLDKLMEVATHRHSDVRAIVSSSLAKRGQSAANVLCRLLEEPDGPAKESSRHAFAEAVIAMGPAVIPTIVELLERRSLPHPGAAISVLGAYGSEVAEYVPLVISYLDTEAKEDVINTLGQLGDTAKIAIPTLITLIQNDDYYAFKAARALGRITHPDTLAGMYPQLKCDEAGRPDLKGKEWYAWPLQDLGEIGWRVLRKSLTKPVPGCFNTQSALELFASKKAPTVEDFGAVANSGPFQESEIIPPDPEESDAVWDAYLLKKNSRPGPPPDWQTLNAMTKRVLVSHFENDSDVKMFCLRSFDSRTSWSDSDHFVETLCCDSRPIIRAAGAVVFATVDLRASNVIAQMTLLADDCDVSVRTTARWAMAERRIILSDERRRWDPQAIALLDDLKFFRDVMRLFDTGATSFREASARLEERLLNGNDSSGMKVSLSSVSRTVEKLDEFFRKVFDRQDVILFSGERGLPKRPTPHAVEARKWTEAFFGRNNL